MLLEPGTAGIDCKSSRSSLAAAPSAFEASRAERGPQPAHANPKKRRSKPPHRLQKQQQQQQQQQPAPRLSSSKAKSEAESEEEGMNVDGRGSAGSAGCCNDGYGCLAVYNILFGHVPGHQCQGFVDARGKRQLELSMSL